MFAMSVALLPINSNSIALGSREAVSYETYEAIGHQHFDCRFPLI